MLLFIDWYSSVGLQMNRKLYQCNTIYKGGVRGQDFIALISSGLDQSIKKHQVQ